MRKGTQIVMFIALCFLAAGPVFSDTLILKTGEKITGYYEGGSARVVKFRAGDGPVKDYDILAVQQLQFGEDKTATTSSTPSPSTQPATRSSSSTTSTAPAAAAATSQPSDGPRLRSNTERVTQPISANAANTAWTIPTGSTLVIRMLDSVNSERNKVGETFVATLEEAVVQGGVEVIPRGADVRGRIANVNEAGRIAGSAQLGLELTQVVVNGIPYSLTTSEYQEVGEGRGAQTAKRAGVGAGIGAVIGAIAGGGKGAAIGAGVGGGGATAVQVLTKGEKLNIPAETKLEFTLRAPLVVAGK
jgi:hypothetical protein